jgi:uncharacterized OB-fold protein
VSADNVSAVQDWTQGAATLLVRSCNDCAHRWYFERVRCPRCASANVAAVAAEGRGTAVATTTIRRAPGAAVGEVPFSIALVDLDEGVRVMGRCAADTRPGDRVALGFQASLDGGPVPFFERQGGTP